MTVQFGGVDMACSHRSRWHESRVATTKATEIKRLNTRGVIHSGQTPMQVETAVRVAPQSSNPWRPAKATAPLQRNEYGAIAVQTTLNDVCRRQVESILAQAINCGHLNAPYLRRNNREMECLNHDIYDVLLERGRVRAVIIQERAYWKSLRKTRSRLTKRYVLLTRVKRSLRTEELDTATCVKRAKNTEAIGDLVRHYTGAATVRCKTPQVVVEQACKVLARDADGTLRSVYDGSEYQVGVWRSEAVAAGHGGGYYFYRSEEDAVAGMTGSTTFASAWMEGLDLVLCEVDVAGRTIEYDNGKLAASRLRVLGVLRALQRREELPT